MIEEKLIFVGVDVQDKMEVLEYMEKKLKEEKLLKSDNSFINSVLEREYQMSTNIGYGIAIPHGRSEGVYRPFIALLKPRDQIIWNDNEDPINVVFMIGVPEGEGGVHLKYISKISKSLMHESFRDKLLKTEDSKSIYELFKEEI